MELFGESSSFKALDVVQVIGIFIGAILILALILFLKAMQDSKKDLLRLNEIKKQIKEYNSLLIQNIISQYKIISEENSELVKEEQIPEINHFYEEKDFLTFVSDISRIQQTVVVNCGDQLKEINEKNSDLINELKTSRKEFEDLFIKTYLMNDNPIGKIVCELKREEFLDIWKFYKEMFNVESIEDLVNQRKEIEIQKEEIHNEAKTSSEAIVSGA